MFLCHCSDCKCCYIQTTIELPTERDRRKWDTIKTCRMIAAVMCARLYDWNEWLNACGNELKRNVFSLVCVRLQSAERTWTIYSKTKSSITWQQENHLSTISLKQKKNGFRLFFFRAIETVSIEVLIEKKTHLEWSLGEWVEKKKITSSDYSCQCRTCKHSLNRWPFSVNEPC